MGCRCRAAAPTLAARSTSVPTGPPATARTPRSSASSNRRRLARADGANGRPVRRVLLPCHREAPRNPMRGLLLKPSGVGTGWIRARDPRAHVCQDVVAQRRLLTAVHILQDPYPWSAMEASRRRPSRSPGDPAAEPVVGLLGRDAECRAQGREVCGFSCGVGNRLRLARRRTSTANARRRVCDHVTAGVPLVHRPSRALMRTHTAVRRVGRRSDRAT